MQYRNDGPWGLGKGSPLTTEEGDANMWEIEQRLAALESGSADADPVGISNIEVVGTQMMIYLTNGDSYGPFTLPTAMLRFRGEAVNGLAVIKNDLLKVRGRGLFLVLQNHSVVLPFDPDRVTVPGGEAMYSKVFGEDTYIYDIGWFYPGKPGQGIATGQNMLEHTVARAITIPIDWGKSVAKLDISAASNMVLPVKKNGTQFGVITIAAGTKVGVFSWQGTPPTAPFPIAEKDTVQIGRPVAVDATATGLTVTITAETALG